VWRYSCLKLACTDPMEDVPLAKRMHTVFQHDGAHAHYSRLVTHHLNLTFHQGPQTLLLYIFVCGDGWNAKSTKKCKHKMMNWSLALRIVLPRQPQESYMYYCQENWKVHWSWWWDFWTCTVNCCNHLHNQLMQSISHLSFLHIFCKAFYV
jgi:hypothetical protein